MAADGSNPDERPKPSDVAGSAPQWRRSGELVAGTDNLFNNYVLSSASGPAGSLPSTSTAPSVNGTLALLLVAVAFLGAALVAHRIVPRRR